MKPHTDSEGSRDERVRGGEVRATRIGAWAKWGVLVGVGIALAEAADRQEPVSAGVPIGTIVAFAGSVEAVPETQGWMLCDGRE
ncbi:MAG: phage tail protein, partial [Nitrospira sp.]|nr:phage tail protein [Nitrospira sp.]